VLLTLSILALVPGLLYGAHFVYDLYAAEDVPTASSVTTHSHTTAELNDPEHMLNHMRSLDGSASTSTTSTTLENHPAAFQGHNHEGSEGPIISANLGPHKQILNNTSGCPADTLVRAYDVVAIDVKITLNRWGDYDPVGMMYATRSDVPRIRVQEVAGERQNYGLTLGLGADPIQPLAIRANVGDCVRVSFTNQLDQPASFHIHGADVILTNSGEPALSTNPDSVASPFESISMEWYVDPEYYSENTHYVHSHGPKSRYQVSHGLFGAIVIEQHNSEYFDPRTGDNLCTENFSGALECENSWDAMISPGDGSSDFREYAMFYHSIGNAQFLTLDRDGLPNPAIDPLANSYRPNGFAINYRSESFFRRLSTMEEAVGYGDESQAYGSFSFGDPAMPIPQSYLGDPIKFRLIHGGSETFHVPHLHGGGIQWQRQQDMGKGSDVDYTPIDAGLKKHFTNRMPSSGNDSQTIGPSETYELEIACGSGGCQQTVGDFLFHCHVASHYVSGMWHFWRVYNTRQSETHTTDNLSILAALPDRNESQMAAAVTSEDLIGREISYGGVTSTVTSENLHEIVESQLPAAGVPQNLLDAAVFDWTREGDLYLNAPETEHEWPNYSSLEPGERFALMFNPEDGKLAWPFLKPHLGQRPPFAPNHGPSPYLEPVSNTRAEPSLPGAHGERSLCPLHAPRRLYKIHAVQTDIPVTHELTDPDGMIFVLKENEELARSNPDYKVPLAIRANQGDCVDIIFVNELEETGERAELSKTNIHIHFVQFDVQASDGVITGASYEQSPRPFIDPEQSFALTANAGAGENFVEVSDTSSFHVGSAVAIGIDQDVDNFETAIIDEIEGNRLIFKDVLRNDHSAGELVSVEYVRYRWYVARQNGAIYFHDHVDALKRWGHGLFGALIAEPTGSSYHDPTTGDEIASGPIADIHVDTNITPEVLPGLNGSFREFVLFINDRNPYTRSSINLRAEPLQADTERGSGPPEYALSSVMHSDPATPVLRAYVGDPIMLRLLTTATEEVHPFHITGHPFRVERFQQDSPLITTFGVGISERFNAYIEAAGGVSQKPGDYLYYNGTERHFIEGSWGILRVHDSEQGDLQPLPGNSPSTGTGFPDLEFTGEAPPDAASPGDPCPSDAPERIYQISAIDLPIIFNQDAGMRISSGKLYVLSDQVDVVLSGEQSPEPLTIRANSGDCLILKLTNEMAEQSASINLDALGLDPQGSLGITLGFNPDQTIESGESIEYKYFAERELGSVLMRDFGDIYRNAREGLYGAVIIEPRGSRYLDPVTGSALLSGLEAVIETADGEMFREFVTIFHDADPDAGLFIMPYEQDVDALVGVNYSAEPLTLRLAQFGVLRDEDFINSRDFERAKGLYDSSEFGDPKTNVFESFTGEQIRLRVISAYSEQNQVFSVEGHQWARTPQLSGSDILSSRYLTPTGVLNIELTASQYHGDYIWGNHRLPFEKAGQWGLIRVLDSDVGTSIKRFDAIRSRSESRPVIQHYSIAQLWNFIGAGI